MELKLKGQRCPGLKNKQKKIGKPNSNRRQTNQTTAAFKVVLTARKKMHLFSTIVAHSVLVNILGC